jgi:malate permease and related proteins
MGDILLKFLPVFGGMAIAFSLKRAGIVRPEHGRLLLKISLRFTIPCLIFIAISRAGIDGRLLIFPFLSAILLGVTYLFLRFVVKKMHMPAKTEGTFLTAPLAINSGFTLPFVLAVFGSEGLTRVILFNAGYNPLLLIGVYGLAAAYNTENKSRRDILKRILIMPPLWALLAGIAVNVSGLTVPATAASVLELVGSATLPLMIAALGILFTPRRLHLDKTLAAVGLRMGLGLLIGLAIVFALGLEGIDRAVVLALAAAPIGFNLLAFTSLEKLDEELAANAVSLSLVAALVVTPLILLLAR